jgi:hypothetical protein
MSFYHAKSTQKCSLNFNFELMLKKKSFTGLKLIKNINILQIL